MDCGCAPGSWSQVAAQYVNAGGIYDEFKGKFSINFHSGYEWFHETLYIFVSYAKDFPDFLTVTLSNFFWQILNII